MGYHSLNFYNTKCFKGNTDTTGWAWWYEQSRENPDRPSHYPGFIPTNVMKDVLGWTAEETVRLDGVFMIDGQEYVIPITDFKAIGRGDWIVNGIPENEESGASQILSVVSSEYGVHQAKEVFIKNVEELLDGEGNIGVESFGELKWGRRLFASFSIPENLENEESGLKFRPILTVVTSYDRTLATKYVRTFGVPICDNTLNWELMRAGDKDGSFTLKHSKNSAGRLSDAKKVLGLLTEQSEAMDVFAKDAFETQVPEDKFLKWLDVMVPIPEIKKTLVTVKSVQGEDVEIEKVSVHAQTIALKKRDKLIDMWDKDDRVRGPEGQWKNTKLGVLQLWNTFQQHEASFKGAKAMDGDKVAARVQQNMDKTISGAFAVEDAKALKALDTILADDEQVKVAVPAGAPTSTGRRRSKAQSN